MKTAFGLDLAGYSTGKSSLARADRKPDGSVHVCVYTGVGNPFQRPMDGKDRLNSIVGDEVRVLRSCARHRLCVDIPIDLQDLNCCRDREPYFVWQLTRRPVDYAFSAIPPLSDRIGAPVARFGNLLRTITPDGPALGDWLFETYPAASLRVLECWKAKYKGQTCLRLSSVWTGNAALAQVASQIGFVAEDGVCLSDDDVDASICAITALADNKELLHGDELKTEIASQLGKKIRKVDQNHIRSDPPVGYRLLKSYVASRKPIRIVVKSIATIEELDEEIANAVR